MLDATLPNPQPGDRVTVTYTDQETHVGTLRAVNYQTAFALVDLVVKDTPQLFLTYVDNISLKERRAA